MTLGEIILKATLQRTYRDGYQQMKNTWRDTNWNTSHTLSSQENMFRGMMNDLEAVDATRHRMLFKCMVLASSLLCSQMLTQCTCRMTIVARHWNQVGQGGSWSPKLGVKSSSRFPSKLRICLSRPSQEVQTAYNAPSLITCGAQRYAQAEGVVCSVGM